MRTIGDPEPRFGEDKLRLLRAVRFAARFGFRIEPETMSAIQRLAPRSSRSRPSACATNWYECLPRAGARCGFELLDESGLLAKCFPKSRR